MIQPAHAPTRRIHRLTLVGAVGPLLLWTGDWTKALAGKRGRGMMRWAICCAMSLTLSGWAGERTVTVPGKERWVAFSDLSPQGEDLTVKIVPKDCWELTGQDVTIELMDDELAWVREVHTGQEHRYKMVAGLGMSSREWIRVDGKVKYICEKKGGGAPPDFRVTVTAVDVDAQGLEQDTDEQTEETVGAFICMDTNAVLPPRKAVYVRPVEPSPQEGNQTLKWPSAVSLWTGDDLSATKLSGSSVSLSPTATTTYWMQGETPATDVYLELQHTNKDGQKATDKVKVTVLKVESVDVHSSDTNTHKIASVLTNGMDHFVCVKDTGDIILDAVIAPTNAADAITWEADGATITSPAVGGDKTTAKLPSATSQKIPVRIKVGSCTCWSGTTWVVWSSLSATSTGAITSVRLGTGGDQRLQIRSGGYDFAADIQPTEITTDSDIPNLKGPKSGGPPGTTNTCGKALSGGATNKWDISRRMRVKHINPDAVSPIGSPACIFVEKSYPSNEVEGNDDATTDDPEDNNPYDAPQGRITGTDAPRLSLFDNTGTNGSSVEVRAHWGEFLRVELGTNWYRASDFLDWRVHFRFLKESGVWTNNATDKALDNSGW